MAIVLKVATWNDGNTFMQKLVPVILTNQNVFFMFKDTVVCLFNLKYTEKNIFTAHTYVL